MGVETELEQLIRRAVRDGVQESRSVFREELRAVVADLESKVTDSRISPDDEVDTKTAARLAGVERRTVTSWKREGLLSPTRRGRQYFFRAGDVLEVAARRGVAVRKVIDMRAEAARILGRRGRKEPK
jgi:hypothetical protein